MKNWKKVHDSPPANNGERKITMEVFTQAVTVLENITFVAGILVLIFGLIQLFTAFGSQNADSKNHSGFIIAADIGVMVVAKVLIPLVASQVSF